MLISIILLITGLVVLLFGGDIFVKGASSIASKLKLSPIVIGLTIVSFGTSAPELVVNLFSATQGVADLAVGNILGSNIANILLVLGVAAIIRPLKVKGGTTWKEIPFGFLALLVFFFLINDIAFAGATENLLSRGDGLVLLSFFIIFMVYTFGLSKVEGEKEDDINEKNWPQSIFFILLGIEGLILGGKLIVDNATILAKAAGLSELFIGLTITAIGTSLPELTTSAIAAYRGHVEMAVGNVVGSNVFNILWILGITPVVAPFTIASAVNTDIMVAAFAAILLFFFMLFGGQQKRHSLHKKEGILFILMYIGYIGYIAIRG